MIEPLINRTIDNRWLVLGLTLILVGFGLFAAVHLPVDAYGLGKIYGLFSKIMGLDVDR